MDFSHALRFPRRHPVWSTLVAVLAALLLVFDWNWLRPPLERYISHRTQREFHVSDLQVRLGLTPTIRLRGLYFGNASWAKEAAMAKIDAAEFSVSLRDLPAKIVVPHVALTRPELNFERLADGRKNWLLAEPDETQPSKLRVDTLSVDQGRLRYFDHGQSLELDLQADTFDPAGETQAAAGTKNAGPPADGRYSTRFRFSGKYHGTPFSGEALTGAVLSLQESGTPFPVKGSVRTGATRFAAEGTIADAMRLSAIDAHVRLEGRSLSTLYPFLPLPLPTTPPYRLAGRLVLTGNRYAVDDLTGRIGSTDLNGQAAYLRRAPRPLLQADLHSALLDLDDLGPLIGMQKKTVAEAAPPGPPDEKPASPPAGSTRRVLPAGRFDGERLQQIDAEVSLAAKRLRVPVALPLESLNASLRLHDAQLEVAPLNFGFGGGTLASEVRIDAREPVLATQIDARLQGVRVDRLMPGNETMAQGAGLLGATVHLQGRGNSVAEMLAQADGRIAATIAQGRISNLLDAISGLNLGKALRLWALGDREITVNCGGFVFDVKNGRGTSRLLVVDTEQTQVLGGGWFDLGREQFEIAVAPKPKRPGLLSLRSPVRLHGSFGQPDYSIEKGPLLARAGGAVALGAVVPWAALLPLTETGPGQDTDCRKVQNALAPAQRQANTTPRRR